jgi:hypothetical protein
MKLRCTININHIMLWKTIIINDTGIRQRLQNQIIITRVYNNKTKQLCTADVAIPLHSNVEITYGETITK